MKQYLMAAVLTFTFAGAVAQAEERLIVVNGIAEKSLDPNMVQLEISVWSKAGTAKQAQVLAAQSFKQIKKTFDTFKIKKEDIQTTGYNLSPNYEYDQKAQRNKLIGYQVTQTLSVVVRKIEDTGNFLDDLIDDKKEKGNETGVNVTSISWDSDKREQAVTAALGDAVRAAKTKAEEIAKAAGVKIRNVSKISHTTFDGGPRPFAGNFMKAAVDSAASTEVAQGQVRVRVEVSAEYEIQ